MNPMRKVIFTLYIRKKDYKMLLNFSGFKSVLNIGML